jgi:hypothetical protein
LRPSTSASARTERLLRLGADLEARTDKGKTALRVAPPHGPDLVPVLLELGASADTRDARGISPLMASLKERCDAGNCFLPLVEHSSAETHRAVDDTGSSALDYLFGRENPVADNPETNHVVFRLLSSGASIIPENAPYVLSYTSVWAARLAARAGTTHQAAGQQQQQEQRAGAPPLWRMHEAVVRLALDLQEVREAEEGVRAREARVLELERELLGAEEESEGGSSDEESGGGGGGGGDEGSGGA